MRDGSPPVHVGAVANATSTRIDEGRLAATPPRAFPVANVGSTGVAGNGQGWRPGGPWLHGRAGVGAPADLALRLASPADPPRGL